MKYSNTSLILAALILLSGSLCMCTSSEKKDENKIPFKPEKIVEHKELKQESDIPASTIALDSVEIQGVMVPVLNPGVYNLDLSLQGEKDFKAQIKKVEQLHKKMDKENLSWDDLSVFEQDMIEQYDMGPEEYWDIEGPGCSWYCGGGPFMVTASSSLDSNYGITYEPWNAHDLNYKEVWAEGAEGNGVGEFLEYHFKYNSPRITEINVVNGYVKSEYAWNNNSRVKKLLVYYNDIPFAVLNLNDERASQSFAFDPIGNNRDENYKFNDTTDWTLKFEILEVYPGDKYDDVVISEIYFDGIDVHCFAAGTKVTMADQSEKAIEDLQIGDSVLSYNIETSSYEPAVILELASPYHHGMVQLDLNDGNNLICTKDHPILSANGLWLSLLPEKTSMNYLFSDVDLLDVNSEFLTINSLIGIKSITDVARGMQTYTIVKLNRNNAFIANGVVVGTEELRINK